MPKATFKHVYEVLEEGQELQVAVEQRVMLAKAD